MSFNGSGTFVINSTGQPVVTGTVISSSTFNSLTADLGTGLSTTVTKDGQTTTTAKIPFALGLSAAAASNFAAGTVGLPAIYLSTDTTTGLYRIGANNDGFAVSGAKVLDIASTGLGITGTLKLAGATSGTTTVIATDAVTATITLPSATATLATLGANTFVGNQAITGTLSIGSNAAAAGSLRMPFNAAIAGRNNANTGDVNIAYIDTGDKLVLGGAAGVNLPAGASLSIAVNLAVANNLVLGDTGTTYNSGSRYVYIYGVSGLAGYIAHDGATTVSYTSVSDARNKNDLGPASDADAADRLLRYEIRNYTWKHTPDEVKIGGMAQQIHSVNPQVGHMGGEDAKLDPWTIEKAAYTDDLVLGWQNHEAKIAALEARLAALEAK